MTCHGQLSPQEDRRFESLHRRVCEPSPVGPQAITSLAVQVRNGLSAGGRWIRTCMGLFLSSGCLGCADSFLFGAGKAVFRSLTAPQVSRLEENSSQRWWDVIGEMLFFWFG